MTNTKQPAFMGILNVTPDSFSDGGEFFEPSLARKRVEELCEHKADIIDIGAESSRPGSQSIGHAEELRRLKPLLDSLQDICKDSTKLSIDTYRASTAAYCLERGFSIVNDISGLRNDPELLRVVKDYDASVAIMYSKENAKSPNATENPAEYIDIIKTISEFLHRQIDLALSAGLRENQIILDPGMGGFLSPDPEHSWEVLRRLTELRRSFSAFPFLIGTSRKSFLGGEIQDRDPLSQLSALHAIESGADIIRTHNVEMARSFHKAWLKLHPLKVE